MNKLMIILLSWISLSWASNHYIDKNANGLNNGTSWVNAWQSFSAIYWASIQPGDIIYISGGTDSTVYYEALEIEASGTKTNPVTVRNSYEYGHNGRVILDGNGYTISTGLAINGLSYVYVKGLEVRRFGGAVGGVHITDNANVITIDSLLIYDNRGRGIRIAGDDADPTVTNYADSITVKNSYIITRKDEPDNQTDCIYVQDAANIFIHNNFLRMNQVHPSNFTHSDPLQAHRTRGWKISNNYIVCDQETFANAVILGAWDLTTDSVVDSVIFYNNFILATGTMTRTGVSDLTVFLMRWYDRSGAVHPPTVVIHNTIISYGRNYYNTKMEYEIDYAANNIFAQYGDGVGEYHTMIQNSSNATIPVSSFDNNLYYREWTAEDWRSYGEGSYWSGNGNTVTTITSGISWFNTYGGNGIVDNPELEYDFSNYNTTDLINYTMEDWRNGVTPTITGAVTSNSLARNQGLDLKSAVEGMGFEWKDIHGNARDSSPTIGAYQYIGSDSTISLSVNIINGWNLVSVPGINPNGMDIDTWWPDRNNSTPVFKFDYNYFPVTTTTPGEGYWMKHSGANIYNTGDEWPAGGIQIVPHDPITATTGWNLIGGYENIAPTAAITTNPPGLIGGPVYKYSGQYQVATTIKPGYGYWIKLTGPGQIILPETLSKENEPTDWFPKDWGRIFLQDATGINYTLYAVKGKVDLNQYELPPAPPEGMFDIRFSTGRIAEDLNSAIKTIEMSGVTYPLTVRVEGMDVRMQDETGKQINTNLKSREDLVISDGTIDKLLVSSELKPTKYMLEQNYPNPFNPSTLIEFSLPENVSNVKLSIYNALGEKVAELVNTVLTAGKYQYQWNAQNVATGMYIYELRTDNFISVKKMLLMK